MSEARQTEIMELSRDKVTDHFSIIGTDHQYIHEGKAFSAIIQAGSINAAYDICFTTPAATKAYIHWRPLGITTSANYVGIAFTEGETFSAGSSVTPVNRNRVLAVSPVYNSYITDMVANATCTPAGTVLWAGGAGTTGNPQSRTGGMTSQEEEIVLKPETKYCLTLTPAGATTVNVLLYWYEEKEGYYGTR